ncbi:MAG: amino acid permease [Deltaproteobacteria bacterium]|nr:amino acid permease [Deltaproteobacteria bacterium]
MIQEKGRYSMLSSGKNAQARFGTFGGVFTPCVLTILGVIMFMRSGFVLGYAGLWLALLILGMSKLITSLTTFSLSAIATNLKMKGGGPYFMISRELGPDFGGSIGITLYVAQAVGVAFYVIGFTEAVFEVFPQTLNLAPDTIAYMKEMQLPKMVATVVTALLFALTFKGADVAIRAQYFILGILLLAVACFIVGGIIHFDSANFSQNRSASFTGDIGFWTVFAIFFPATTGITAGVNLSGDLKDPAKSIPKGTLAAIAFTAGIYLMQLILMSGAIPTEALKETPFQSLKHISVFGPLIVLGVFAATLSSALGSFLGAPRILQAMGHDRLMGVMVFFGKGSGNTNEPRRATVLTFGIAVAVIWAGDLNAVAEVISMFFLIAYGMINLSAFVESRSGNPTFRPTFRFFHWGVGLAGVVACVVAMLKINDTYALVAFTVTAIIYFYLKKQDIQTSYGDARRGYIFRQTRDNLLTLAQSKPHPRNWRPIITAVTESPHEDAFLLQMGAWLEGERGLYSAAHIVERPTDELVPRIRFQRECRNDLKQLLEKETITACAETLVTGDFFEGLSCFLQTYSLDGVRPNTVLIGMPAENDTASYQRFLKTVETIATFDLNMVVFKPGFFTTPSPNRTIDVWWRGQNNGSLMALFAYLLSLDVAWSDATIRFLRIVQNDDDEREGRLHMSQLKNRIRLPVQIEIIRSSSSASDVIIRHSGTSSLVLLGMRATSGDEAKRSLEWLTPMLDLLPSTLLVWSNGEADIFV